MSSKVPRYKLAPHLYEKGVRHTVGGYRDNKPDRKILTYEEPYVTGEEYKIYEEHGILVFDKMVESEESDDEDTVVADNYTAKVRAKQRDQEADSVQPEKTDESDNEPQEDSESIDEDIREFIEKAAEEEPEKHDIDAGDNLENSDELDLQNEDLPETEDRPEIPEDGELKNMLREELVDLAKRVEEWENVEGTGKNGHKKVTDIIRHLKEVREEG